jgi:PAS domain-containing protein
LLRASEFRWKFAVEGSGDGLWDWDVPNSRVFFSTRWKEMLGFAQDEVGNGLDEWSKRVHPGARQGSCRLGHAANG